MCRDNHSDGSDYPHVKFDKVTQGFNVRLIAGHYVESLHMALMSD